MTDSKQMKKDESKMGIGQVAAVVTGVVVGAGLAIAGAVALSNKNNRAKIDNAVAGAKKQGADFINDVKNVVSDKKSEVDSVLQEGKNKAEKLAKVIKE